ncbi:SURF1 family cytochrome oxidase biogenesis protein [Brevundimonas sp. LF-1]|uniref:SURF1 family cytochrome oxidase biogenesis protein n=1 Tax=Brevundimonas sp. LF-1 TaxID=3126100 RepID=UPI0030E57138
MTDAARPRFPYVLTVVTVLALALLLTLGVWQAQRLQWKLDLIARSEAAARQAPVPLADALALEDPEFRQAIVTCRGLNTAPFVELQTIEDGDAGVRLISACPIQGRGPFWSIAASCLPRSPSVPPFAPMRPCRS